MSVDSHVLPVAPEVDLAITKVMVDELETYIVNDDLYRTLMVRVPGQGDVKVQMTGGDLLTRLYRLNAQMSRMGAAQQVETDRLSTEARQVMYSLKTRFHERLQREMKARLDSLRWFLDEASEEPSRSRANYPYEIRNRQRIEEILKELGSDIPEELKGQLAAVDRRLRAIAAGDQFVWDPALREVFPSPPYWYLYVQG